MPFTLFFHKRSHCTLLEESYAFYSLAKAFLWHIAALFHPSTYFSVNERGCTKSITHRRLLPTISHFHSAVYFM